MNLNFSLLAYGLLGVTAGGYYGHSALVNARAVVPVTDMRSEALAATQMATLPDSATDAPARPRAVIISVPITPDMMVDPWTGMTLTADDRATGYILAPPGTAVAATPAVAEIPSAETRPAEPRLLLAANDVAADTLTDLTIPPFWTRRELPSAEPAQAPPPHPKPEPKPEPEALPAAEPPSRPLFQPAAAPAPVPAVLPAAGAYHAHLASYRSEESALDGWKALLKKHGARLQGRQPVLSVADIPGRGRFVRLMVGSFEQRADAARFCAPLAASGQYCQPLRANSGS